MNKSTNVPCDELLEALPCYVTLQDRELNVIWANGRVFTDFGVLSDKKCFELFRIDSSKCVNCPLLKTFEDGQIHTKEMLLTKIDGEKVNVVTHTAAIRDEKGAIVSVVKTAVNITSFKEIRNQLILLGETVAGMAHSIKNIMMGLDGGIYVVNKGIEDKNQAEIKEGWDMVLLNFDKISHIVKDILYCSKEREPNLQRIRPNEIATQIYNLFKDVAASYGTELRTDLDETLREAVIDPVGLHTVLSNLVGNAMDACKMDLWKENHVVEIRTRSNEEGSTIIEVADNGIGIDKDVKEHVFEDFFSSKGDKGTGLGLMVTQKIMREHGGTITFRSRPSRGTTFVAVFPARKEPQDE